MPEGERRLILQATATPTCVPAFVSVPVVLTAENLTMPKPKCGLTSNEKVRLAVVNFGFDTITANTAISVAYQRDNQPVVVVNVILSKPLNPSDTFLFTFNQPVDLSQQGRNYRIQSWVSWQNDQNSSNDTTSKRIFASNVPSKPAVTGDTVCVGEQATLSAFAAGK